MDDTAYNHDHAMSAYFPSPCPLVGTNSDGEKLTLIAQCTVASSQDIISANRLPEDLDAQDVRNDLLRLPLNVWVHQRHVVVAADDVSQGGQALFYPLDLHRVGNGVSQMLEFLVGGGGWDK